MVAAAPRASTPGSTIAACYASSVGSALATALAVTVPQRRTELPVVSCVVVARAMPAAASVAFAGLATACLSLDLPPHLVSSARLACPRVKLWLLSALGLATLCFCWLQVLCMESELTTGVR